MSTAKLNIWISDLDKPCKISNIPWYVNIYTCDGEPLEWCGKRYIVLKADCGHLEVEVPPGCYTINAVWGYYQTGGAIYGNHFTDHAIVNAKCGEETCITLYTPQAHRCGLIFKLALEDLVRHGQINKEIAFRAIEAVKAVIDTLPKPINRFELGILEEIDKKIREAQ